MFKLYIYVEMIRVSKIWFLIFHSSFFCRMTRPVLYLNTG